MGTKIEVVALSTAEFLDALEAMPVDERKALIAQLVGAATFRHDQREREAYLGRLVAERSRRGVFLTTVSGLAF